MEKSELQKKFERRLAAIESQVERVRGFQASNPITTSGAVLPQWIVELEEELAAGTDESEVE